MRRLVIYPPAEYVALRRFAAGKCGRERTSGTHIIVGAPLRFVRRKHDQKCLTHRRHPATFLNRLGSEHRAELEVTAFVCCSDYGSYSVVSGFIPPLGGADHISFPFAS